MCQTKGVVDIENGRKDSDAKPKPRNYEHKSSRPIHFEDALALTKFGKFNYFIILICGIILNAALMETCGISFVLPVAQCDMKLTTQDKGILGAVGFLGIITSSYLWGFLADTKGRRRVIKPTLLIAFTCTLLSTLTNNFWLFATLRYLAGFFISGSSATVYAYLGEFHDNRQRSRAIMGAALIFGIFCVLLPVIAWSVINQDWELYLPIVDIVFKPWRLFLIVCGLPSIVSFCALHFLPESPKFVLGQGNQEYAIEILGQMNRWNNGGKLAEPLGINEIYEELESVENRKRILDNKDNSFSLLRSMWAQTAPLFKPPYLRTTLLACTIQFGIFATSNGMYMWFPEILNRMANNLDDFTSSRISMCDVITMNLSNPNDTAIDLTAETEMHCVTKLEMSTYEHSIVLEILYVIGFALIGAFINAVGKLPILVTIVAGCGIAGIISILVDIPIVAIYLYVILLCCGLGVTVVNAATVELYPTNLRAMAVCISLMMGRVGSVVGSNVVAILLDYHCESAFLSSGISLIICGILAFFIPNIRQNPSKKELNLEPRLSIVSRIK